MHEKKTIQLVPAPHSSSSSIANSMLVISWKPGKSLHKWEEPVCRASFSRVFFLRWRKKIGSKLNSHKKVTEIEKDREKKLSPEYCFKIYQETVSLCHLIDFHIIRKRWWFLIFNLKYFFYLFSDSRLMIWLNFSDSNIEYWFCMFM